MHKSLSSLSNTSRFYQGLLIGAVLLLMIAAFWYTSRSELSASVITTSTENPIHSLTVIDNTFAAIATKHCTDSQTQHRYFAIRSDDWRQINEWQQRMGFNVTRLLANGELTQEPHPYIYYDEAALVSLAKQADEDALYWLALRWQHSNVIQVQFDHLIEDKNIVIPRLLHEAALLGHVPAMQTQVERYQRAIAANGQSSDFPDWAIHARAWQWVMAWRTGDMPNTQALENDNELQALRLSEQLIADLQQRRAVLNKLALNNQRPAALMQLKHLSTHCEPAHIAAAH